MEKTEHLRIPVRRLETLDLLRGLTLVSMILYHGMWDFLYLSETGASMTALRTWYEGTGGHLWQQSICRTFILLSGFCVPFSRRVFRRGLQVSGGGIAVSAVTLLAMYEDRVFFGVLTFLGAAMLLTGALDRRGGLLRERTKNPEKKAAAGLVSCLLLFHITRWVNQGFLRFGPALRISLPSTLYVSEQMQESFGGRLAGWILTALGFPMKGFFSTDYFSLFPWIFLFLAGVCLHRFLAAYAAGSHQRGSAAREAGGPAQTGAENLFRHPLLHVKLPVLNWMGTHSLLIYLLHQPVLYLLISVFFRK